MKRICGFCMCLCLLMGMGQVQGVRASEDAYIPNDETGIPDPDLYGVILDNGDLNGDGKLSVKEANFIYQLEASLLGTISDLRGIAYLTNLTDLYIDENNISDLTPLKDLKNLKRLIIEYNHIEDISVLAEIPTLEGLSISHNEIKDASALAQLTNLTSLYIGYNQLTSLPDLTNLNQLDPKYTSFAGNSITAQELKQKLPAQFTQSEDWIQENACTDCEVKNPEEPDPDKPEQPEQPDTDLPEQPDDTQEPSDPIHPSEPTEPSEPSKPILPVKPDQTETGNKQDTLSEPIKNTSNADASTNGGGMALLGMMLALMYAWKRQALD